MLLASQTDPEGPDMVFEDEELVQVDAARKHYVPLMRKRSQTITRQHGKAFVYV
jgi:hypothetical protein